METPLVSIVMPVFNNERYVSKSIESCLDQTYKNWELVIVDDCSTDKTPAIIQQFAERDNRIKIVRNSKNLKLPGAFNAGYRMAEGDFYTWLSSDDLFHPQALQQAIDFLGSNPQYDLVYSNFSTIDSNGKIIDKITVEEPEILAVRNKVGPFRLYRRAVHEKLGGYDESLFLVEDYDFLLRAFCLFELKPLRQELYQFRLHDTALTSVYVKQVPLVRDLAKEKNLPLLKEKSPRLTAKCHISLIEPALKRNEATKARRHALSALLCAPFYVIRHDIRKVVLAMIGLKIGQMLHPSKLSEIKK